MYLETIESQNGKSGSALYSAPGTGRFCTLPDEGVRALLFHQATGRAFAVCGSGFFELFANGTSQALGAVANDGLPASLAQSNIQIMIASGQIGYCFTLAGSGFSANPANMVSPLQVAYDDGFFLSLQANSNLFQYSNALDGLTWNALNKSAISVFPDNIIGFTFDHREIIVFGNTKAIPYYDSGNTFTFDVVQGGYIDDGLQASFAKCRADNTTFYLGRDERGNLVFKRLNGYTPVRVSTHAVEQTWRGYAKTSDANCFPFGWNGHTFIQINFPSANGGRGTSWRYDIVTGTWSEVFFLVNGAEYMHKAWVHMHAFGKHLVGDPNSGNIYELNDTFLTDDGNPIRRVRRGPHIANEGSRITFNKLQIDAEMGLATINGNAPQGCLRWSDDGGKTFGNEHWRSFGKLGEYRTRAIWRQMGQSMDRVFEFSFSDPAPIRIIEGYLDAPGWGRGPTQRLTEKLRQQA